MAFYYVNTFNPSQPWYPCALTRTLTEETTGPASLLTSCLNYPHPLGTHDLEPQMGKSGPVSTAPAKPRLARLRLRFMDSLKAPLSVVRTVTPGSFSREPARRETWWTHRKEVFRCFSPDSDASPRRPSPRPPLQRGVDGAFASVARRPVGDVWASAEGSPAPPPAAVCARVAHGAHDRPRPPARDILYPRRHRVHSAAIGRRLRVSRTPRTHTHKPK